MPAPSDKPLTKITINIYSSDYTELQRIYGRGYSVEIRELIAKHVREKKLLTQSLKEVFDEYS